jgi:zinc protease
VRRLPSDALAPARRTLGNGLTCLSRRTHTHPAVTLALMLPAGASLDPPASAGLAHFVSRVIDRGTAARTSLAIADALDDRGVSLNAGVSRHRFFLSCSCLAEDVGPMVQLMAEVVRTPTFPVREVERRRTEIVTWIRQDADNPAAVATDVLQQLLFDGHAYGRPVKGTLESVQSISRQDLVEFHRSRFAPASATIAVVGDVDPVHAGDLVEQAFGDWSTQAAPPAGLPPPPGLDRRQRRVMRMTGKAQADVAYGLPAVRRGDGEYYAALLMNNILGQYGLGGRLGDSIRERQGLAYYAYSALDANVAAGSLAIRAGVSGDAVDRTIESIDLEVTRMQKDGASAAELSDARRYLIGSMPRVLETNEGIASFLLTAVHFGLGLDYHRRLPALLEAVTLDEVNAVASRLLRADRAAIAVAGPSADRTAGLAA